MAQTIRVAVISTGTALKSYKLEEVFNDADCTPHGCFDVTITGTDVIKIEAVVRGDLSEYVVEQLIESVEETENGAQVISRWKRLPIG